MKRIFVFFLLTIAVFGNAFAQSLNSGVKATPGKYLVYARLFCWGEHGANRNATYYFDYGQPKTQIKDQKINKHNYFRLIDDSGERISQDSFITCVNMLSKLGWVIYGNIFEDDSSFYECWMYKEVSNDAEIIEGIHFEVEKNQ